MKRTRFGLSLLALSFALTGATAAHALQAPPPPGWDAPPSSFRSDIQRRGYHDGIEGARKDRDNHRTPSVMNRDEFRHPDVPRPMWRPYQSAFRMGYNKGVQIFYGPGRRY